MENHIDLLKEQNQLFKETLLLKNHKTKEQIKTSIKL
jgi:hypothetical protein